MNIRDAQKVATTHVDHAVVLLDQVVAIANQGDFKAIILSKIRAGVRSDYLTLVDLLTGKNTRG